MGVRGNAGLVFCALPTTIHDISSPVAAIVRTEGTCILWVGCLPKVRVSWPPLEGSPIQPFLSPSFGLHVLLFTILAPELLDTLCLVLEACVHQLLHNRGVYPRELFERTRLLNIPIHRLRSGDLCAYISEVINSCKPWMRRDLVEAIVLQVIDAKTGHFLENFVFELQQTSLLSQPATVDASTISIELESVLRHFLSKTNSAGAQIGTLCEPNSSESVSASLLPEKQTKPALPLTWKVLMLTYEVDEGESELSKMPWTETDPTELESTEPTVITPLRSTPTPTKGVEGFSLQLFAEKLESDLVKGQKIAIS